MDTCAFTHDHPRTRRCTMHPRTLTTTLTKNKTNHCISVHIWISLASFAHQWMRPFESLLVNKGMGRGSSWSSLDLETLESDVSSGRSAGAIAKDRGWSCSSVRQRVAAIKRGDPSPRHVGGSPKRFDARALGASSRVLEEEHGRISVNIVSSRFTLSRTYSRKAIRCLRLRPLVIRTVLHLEDRHIRDRRKFAEDMLARLALASGRRVSRKTSSSRRLSLDVICCSDEKIFRVDGVAPGRSFHAFSLGKVGPRHNATSLFGIHHAKKVGSLCYHCGEKVAKLIIVELKLAIS